MKLNNYILICFISLTLLSCEQTVTNIELPYLEQLVVNCVLQNGDVVDSLRLERTLPLLEKYDEDKALVKDAKVEISDGENNYTLYYQNGFYKNDSLIATSGKKYSLKIEWKGKKATANTFVPNPVEIPELNYTIEKSSDTWADWYNLKVYCLIKPTKNVVYNSGWGSSYHGSQSYSFYNILREIDTDAQGYCKVNFLDISFMEKIDSTNIKKFLKDYLFILYSYDVQFYQFYITSNNGRSGDEIFGGNSNNIIWNVKGDGIGLFIGRAVTFKSY